MDEKKLINQMWFWICLIPIVLGVLSFIVCMTYALHPTEIRIFANNEMVATSSNIMQIQRDSDYNECSNNCVHNYIYDTNCLDGCDIHYSPNATEKYRVAYATLTHQFDAFLERYGEAISDERECENILNKINMSCLN